MSLFDITAARIILVGAGLIAVIVVLCLLLDEWMTGFGGWLPAWVRVLALVAALLVIVAALAVQRKG